MRVNSTIFGQTIRILKISAPGGGTVYGLNLAKLCEARYGFLQGPRELKDFNATEGITFYHGYFQNRIVIDRFQVFTSGFLAEAKVDTDELDAFLDDIIQWLQQQGGAQIEQDPKASRFYTSQMEVQSDVLLENAFGEFRGLGHEIANLLRGYNQATPDYSMTGFMLGPGPGATWSFRFERREGQAPGVYFSTAPLRTRDHIPLLNSLETVLSARSSSC
jgi:hypothetical protein